MSSRTGDEGDWTGHPFEPRIDGDRLFGRGAADDKAAVIIHALACRVLEDLQANVTIVVDGEEEIGSPHLQEVLSARQMASPDVVIVPDPPPESLPHPAKTSATQSDIGLRSHLRVTVI